MNKLTSVGLQSIYIHARISHARVYLQCERSVRSTFVHRIFESSPSKEGVPWNPWNPLWIRHWNICE